MFDQFQESFREEALDLLSRLEDRLLWLEQNPEPGEEQQTAISGVFRIVHTIKGSAGMFGFDTISSFSHDLENLLDAVRSGDVPLTSEVIDVTLAAKDLIHRLLDEQPGAQLPAEGREILNRLATAAHHGKTAEGVGPQPDLEAIGAEDGEPDAATGSTDRTGAPADQSSLSDQQPRTYHIRFSPPRDLFQNGSNPLPVFSELHELGECTAVPILSDLPKLSELNIDECYVGWDIFLTTRASVDEIKDLFIFFPGQNTISVRHLDQVTAEEPGEYRRLGQILVDRGLVDSKTIEELVSSQRRLGELLVENGVSAGEIESALHEQEHVRKTRELAEAELATQSIRVRSDRLDELVNLVGELVTLQARLGQVSSGSGSGELASVVENFERLIDDLRDRTMEIRMVQISTVFTRLRRLVRDVARDLNKEIQLVASGGETELDKTVIERLSDPLIHIIRNSVDHGIESPDQRVRVGKPRAGSIFLSAQHVGVNVEIRVSDDGAGLNRTRILERAVERGLVESGAELSNEEIDQLIMSPGFSTAEAVTSLSGRGVGMDVVKRELERIGGTIKIDTQPGRGTTIVLSIPLTLAIIDGLLIRVGSDRFVFPLSPVQAVMELEPGRDRHSVSYRGSLLPVIDLRVVFSVNDEVPPRRQIVVATTELGPIGFVVDAVIGNHQTVIKNLGAMYTKVRDVSGATILGDGTVALILDVSRLAANHR